MRLRIYVIFGGIFALVLAGIFANILHDSFVNKKDPKITKGSKEDNGMFIGEERFDRIMKGDKSLPKESVYDLIEEGGYYVDPLYGNDDADGKSPDSAWRTLERVNKAKLRPGDVVRLRGNGLWRGVLRCRSGSSKAPIVYTRYDLDGGDTSPRIVNSVDISNDAQWVRIKDNIWTTNDAQCKLFTNDVGMLVLTPTKPLPPMCGWRFAPIKIFQTPGNGETAAHPRKKLDDLTQQADFYYDPRERRVYFYSEKNPGVMYYSIEACFKGPCVIPADHVQIDSMIFSHSAGEGAALSANRNVVFDRCEFDWIQNDAVLFNEGCKDCFIMRCRFIRTANNGVAVKGKEAALVKNIGVNTSSFLNCERCFSIELDSPDAYVDGVVFAKNECYQTGSLVDSFYRKDEEPRPAFCIFENCATENFENIIIKGNKFLHARTGYLKIRSAHLGAYGLDDNSFWVAPNTEKNFNGFMVDSFSMDFDGFQSCIKNKAAFPRL